MNLSECDLFILECSGRIRDSPLRVSVRSRIVTCLFHRRRVPISKDYRIFFFAYSDKMFWSNFVFTEELKRWQAVFLCVLMMQVPLTLTSDVRGICLWKRRLSTLRNQCWYNTVSQIYGLNLYFSFSTEVLFPVPGLSLRYHLSFGHHVFFVHNSFSTSDGFPRP